MSSNLNLTSRHKHKNTIKTENMKFETEEAEKMPEDVVG